MKSSLSNFPRLTIALVCLAASAARAELPLYEQEPFDQITLNDENNKAVLKVRPLDFPNRKLPAKPDEKTVIRLLDQPDKAYQLDWSAVAKVEFFEQIVLEQAKHLARDGNFASAYAHYHFLLSRYPKLEGLAAAYEDCLYEEAKEAHRRGDYAYALAMLRELHGRNPKRPGLANALPLTTDKLVEKYAAAGNYPAARRLLQGLAAWLPDDPNVVRWQKHFQTQAARLLAEANAARQAGDLRAAHEASRRLDEMWPQLPGAKELAADLQAKHPQVVVGVAWPAERPDPTSCVDWGARRSGRLVHRMLSLCVGVGGGARDYQIPVGTLETDAARTRLTLKLQSGLRWPSGAAALSGYDVARRLLGLAEPGGQMHQPGWDQWLAGVDVRSPLEVQITLRRPHVRPEALLQTMLLPYTDPTLMGKPDISGGPYTLAARSADMVRYAANPQFQGGKPSRPQEIIERRFADREAALSALRTGQVQILDRLDPADLGAARGLPGVKAAPYALPTVHCLAVNLRKPLLAQRALRRALLYALNRQGILNQLLGEQTLPGSRVISGPFPVGPSYDESLAPRAYDPRLAAVLATAALRAANPGANPAKDQPALTLALPAEPLARTACAAIVRQWALSGVKAVLKELPPPAAVRLTDDVDLLYLELIVQEPIVDARRILAADALTAPASPQMREALRQLDLAADDAQARERLRAIHRLAYEEGHLLPLWQITEHYACHESVQGLSGTVMQLYENAPQWEARFSYPTQ